MLQSADIDECALANDNCAETAECNNTPGSFSCTCMAGYSGNGTFCEGIILMCCANSNKECFNVYVFYCRY